MCFALDVEHTLSPPPPHHYRTGVLMARPQRTCRCGHTKGHELVAEEPEYTLWGWILLSMFGITPKPNHVVYRCQMCRQSLGSTRDPNVLARRTATGKNAAPHQSPAPPPKPPEVSTASQNSEAPADPEESPRT